MLYGDLSAEQIKRLYEELIRNLTPLFSEIDFDPNEPFSFEENPKINQILDEYLQQWREKMQISIEKNMSKSWGLSVEKNRQLFEKYLLAGLLTTEEILLYNSQNIEALKVFLKRKTDGLNLSDRIWKLSEQFKNELEMSLDLGLLQEKSAQQISRDIRRFLNEPNQLFRRVRDARGNLHLSKRAEAYHPGQGVYRSSYKNAMRLARTEVNMAYRASDLEKYRQVDFVLGYEIKRSNHPFGCPVCEGLKGKYPKDFQFVGWHPNCRCFTIPILQSVDDFVKGLKGEEVLKNEVDDVPDNFKQWVKDNQERMQTAKSVPYWWKDNQKYVERVLKQENIKKILELPREEQFKTLFESNGGKVLEHLLVRKGKDYESILTSAKEFAKQGKMAEILPELNQRELKEFRKIVFPNYDLNKNPDLRVDGTYHDVKEVESLKNFIKNANRAIKQGAIPILQYNNIDNFSLITKQIESIFKEKNYPYNIIYLLYEKKLHKYNKG